MRYWINKINGKFQVKDYSGNIIKVFRNEVEAYNFKKSLEK